MRPLPPSMPKPSNGADENGITQDVKDYWAMGFTMGVIVTAALFVSVIFVFWRQ